MLLLSKYFKNTIFLSKRENPSTNSINWICPNCLHLLFFKPSIKEKRANEFMIRHKSYYLLKKSELLQRHVHHHRTVLEKEESVTSYNFICYIRRCIRSLFSSTVHHHHQVSVFMAVLFLAKLLSFFYDSLPDL